MVKAKVPILTEDQEQRLLVEWMDLAKLKFTHIPNSTYTKSWNAKRRNTYLGVRSGFPDLVVIAKKKLLIIEMKHTKGGVVSLEQEKWIEALGEAGQIVKVCYGYADAKQFIEKYL